MEGGAGRGGRRRGRSQGGHESRRCCLRAKKLCPTCSEKRSREPQSFFTDPPRMFLAVGRGKVRMRAGYSPAREGEMMRRRGAECAGGQTENATEISDGKSEWQQGQVRH